MWNLDLKNSWLRLECVLGGAERDVSSCSYMNYIQAAGFSGFSQFFGGKLLGELDGEVGCGEAGGRMRGFAVGCSHGENSNWAASTCLYYFKICTILRFVLGDDR